MGNQRRRTSLYRRMDIPRVGSYDHRGPVVFCQERQKMRAAAVVWGSRIDHAVVDNGGRCALDFFAQRYGGNPDHDVRLAQAMAGAWSIAASSLWLRARRLVRSSGLLEHISASDSIGAISVLTR